MFTSCSLFLARLLGYCGSRYESPRRPLLHHPPPRVPHPPCCRPTRQQPGKVLQLSFTRIALRHPRAVAPPGLDEHRSSHRLRSFHHSDQQLLRTSVPPSAVHDGLPLGLEPCPDPAGLAAFSRSAKNPDPDRQACRRLPFFRNLPLYIERETAGADRGSVCRHLTLSTSIVPLFNLRARQAFVRFPAPERGLM